MPPDLRAPVAAPPRATRRLRRALLVVATLACTTLCAAWAGGVRVVAVTTDSMAPTYGTGSRLLTAPVDGAQVEPGQVVIFAPPPAWERAFVDATGASEPPERMVKRVLALGGDTVECCAADGNLLRNGVRLEEPWLATAPGEANTATFRVVVPPGHLWLMGDNRTTSIDARTVQAQSGDGAVPSSAVTARVLSVW